MNTVELLIMIQLQAAYIRELETLAKTNDEIIALNKGTINQLLATNIRLLSEYSNLSDKLKALYEKSQ